MCQAKFTVSAKIPISGGGGPPRPYQAGRRYERGRSTARGRRAADEPAHRRPLVSAARWYGSAPRGPDPARTEPLRLPAHEALRPARRNVRCAGRLGGRSVRSAGQGRGARHLGAAGEGRAVEAPKRFQRSSPSSPALNMALRSAATIRSSPASKAPAPTANNPSWRSTKKRPNASPIATPPPSWLRTS